MTTVDFNWATAPEVSEPAPERTKAAHRLERWHEILSTLEGMFIQVGARQSGITPALRRDLGLE